LGGIVDVQIEDEAAHLIRISMGKVTFLSNEIPVVGDQREVINEPLNIRGVTHQVTCLSIGNPHYVILMEQVSEQTAEELEPLVENNAMSMIYMTLGNFECTALIGRGGMVEVYKASFRRI
jgi:diaminopimelate epimerase